VRALGPDLVFSPFGVPYYATPGVPLVAIIYDLQHLAYPEFFSADQRHFRQQHVRDLARQASRIVCISEFVRHSLLASEALAPARVVTVPLGVLHAAPRLPAAREDALLRELGVGSRPYLLYPANFWPHKNHQRLFEALRAHREARPTSDLVLVCTGADGGNRQTVEAEARRLLPADVVIFAGYVPPDALQSLEARCLALMFPSLYEGFGMPVLEGMAHGRPVLCSNATSLPEVAGDAACLFDPTQSSEIAAAINWLVAEPAAAERLAERGRQRAAQFGTPVEMARRYLEVFEAAVGAC
jgi:glycosyltransferase involved in cell wall biosynthesis